MTSQLWYFRNNLYKKAVDVERAQASSTCSPSLRTSSGLLESFALPADPALFTCPAGVPPPHPPWTPQPATSREPPAPCHTGVRTQMMDHRWIASHETQHHHQTAPASSLLPLEQGFSMGHTGIWLPPNLRPATSRISKHGFACLKEVTTKHIC